MKYNNIVMIVIKLKLYITGVVGSNHVIKDNNTRDGDIASILIGVWGT